ncbi:hypothetical protein [Novosphingobium sp.]|uniref:hypothetical protein n=1 Tax=Novosphingobium sp. TaxID=1874826 RepID=UPI003B529163
MRIAVSGSLLVAAALALGVCLPASAQTPAPAATSKPAAAKYSTSDTDIGTLLDDPAAKAIVEKHIPGMTTNPQIDMARSMTLKAIQAYAASDVTDERLAAIDADFAKLGS